MPDTSKRYNLTTAEIPGAHRASQPLDTGRQHALARLFPPYPLAISHGSGCRVWDVDGNEFVDLLNNYTATVHGHAVPAITRR